MAAAAAAAAAGAVLLQSCQTLHDPIDDSPPGSSFPELLQGRILEWVAISFSNLEEEVYNNNKKYDCGKKKKKKLKSLIRFHSANKSTATTGGRGKGEEKKENIQKNLQNKSKHKNKKSFS